MISFTSMSYDKPAPNGFERFYKAAVEAHNTDRKYEKESQVLIEVCKEAFMNKNPEVKVITHLIFNNFEFFEDTKIVDRFLVMSHEEQKNFITSHDEVIQELTAVKWDAQISDGPEYKLLRWWVTSTARKLWYMKALVNCESVSKPTLIRNLKLLTAPVYCSLEEYAKEVNYFDSVSKNINSTENLEHLIRIVEKRQEIS